MRTARLTVKSFRGILSMIAVACVSFVGSVCSADAGLEERSLIATLSDRLTLANSELEILRAANKVGSDKSSLLELLREIRSLKGGGRALLVGSPGADSGTDAAEVLAVMEPERVVFISSGRSMGMLDGSVVSIGSQKVYAKIVESRATVSAASVQNSFQGKLADLVGCTAQLSAR